MIEKGFNIIRVSNLIYEFGASLFSSKTTSPYQKIMLLMRQKGQKYKITFHWIQNLFISSEPITQAKVLSLKDLEANPTFQTLYKDMSMVNFGIEI